MTRKQRLCQPCQRKHRLHKVNTSLLHFSPALHVSSSHQAKRAMGGLHPNSGGINELSSQDLRGSQHETARLTTLYIKQTYLFGLHLEHHWKLVPPCWAWRGPTTIYNQHPVAPPIPLIPCCPVHTSQAATQPFLQSSTCTAASHSFRWGLPATPFFLTSAQLGYEDGSSASHPTSSSLTEAAAGPSHRLQRAARPCPASGTGHSREGFVGWGAPSYFSDWFL